MSADKYIEVQDLKKPGDLERLSPRDYADLVSRPASMLDVMRVRLELSEVLLNFSERVSEALNTRDQALGGRNRGEGFHTAGGSE